jgi:peptide/nickel transport system ATP-binding protein
MIFQDVRQALNPMMKVGKQITETLELATKNKEQRTNTKEQNKSKALEMLKTLGFEEPEKIFSAYPHQLSGGMCQRIMTAITVIRSPKLLLADEPSSSLDEESQNRCLSLLKEMNQKNKMSLLVISHDLSIIQQFCNRFLIMYAGRIVEEGPAETLFSPLHPYTHALVKALPNKDKRGSVLQNIPGKVPSIEDQLSGCPFAPRCPKAQKICSESFPPEYFNHKEEKKVYCYFPNN